MSSDPKQNGGLFRICYFTILKYGNSALAEVFLSELLFCQFIALPPSSLGQFIVYEPVIHGQERGRLTLQYKHLPWGLAVCSVLGTW